jgi:hypothetical protein
MLRMSLFLINGFQESRRSKRMKSRYFLRKGILFPKLTEHLIILKYDKISYTDGIRISDTYHMISLTTLSSTDWNILLLLTLPKFQLHGAKSVLIS